MSRTGIAEKCVGSMCLEEKEEESILAYLTSAGSFAKGAEELLVLRREEVFIVEEWYMDCGPPAW